MGFFGGFFVVVFFKCVNLEFPELVKLSAADSTVGNGSGVWREGCGISVIFILQLKIILCLGEERGLWCWVGSALHGLSLSLGGRIVWDLGLDWD